MQQIEIKRYIQAINSKGDIVETFDLDNISQEEQSKLLEKVFNQGLERLGYEQSIS